VLGKWEDLLAFRCGQLDFQWSSRNGSRKESSGHWVSIDLEEV